MSGLGVVVVVAAAAVAAVVSAGPTRRVWNRYPGRKVVLTCSKLSRTPVSPSHGCDPCRHLRSEPFPCLSLSCPRALVVWYCQVSKRPILWLGYRTISPVPLRISSASPLVRVEPLLSFPPESIPVVFLVLLRPNRPGYPLLAMVSLRSAACGSGPSRPV